MSIHGPLVSILHYATPPIVGGAEGVIEHHARLMVAAGYSVRLIGGRGEQYDSRIEFRSVPLLDSRHPDILRSKAELDAGRVPSSFAELVDALALQLGAALAGSDVAIVHNICSLHLNLAATAALRRLNEDQGTPRLILWHHDLAWATPRYLAQLHAGWPWDLIRTDWGKVTHVAVSAIRKRELAELMHLPEQRISVIPSGVDPATFLSLGPEAIAMATRWNLWSAEPLLLLPVRLTPRKNIELALRTLARLRQHHFPSAMLLVTGPLGPHNPANRDYFLQLQNLREELGIANSACFVAEESDSFLPHSVIADLYRVADALILPSKEEGFGIPILEASLAHLPIFCTAIPPLQETAREDANYFSPDDSPSHVAAIVAKRLKADGELALRSRVRLEYDWNRIFTLQIEPLLRHQATR